MWIFPYAGKFLATDRDTIYNGGKSRIYHGIIYSDCSNPGLAVGKKAGIKVWIGVVLAVIGMYFLCMTSGLSIAKGDFYIYSGSVAFSFHILVIDHFSPKADGVKMSCIQFFVCGILCMTDNFI